MLTVLAAVRRLRNAGGVSLVGLLMSILSAGAARADLTFALDSTSLAANAGDTVTFTGTITNTTGVSLNATDMFFNFGNYDPTAITNIAQLLGNTDFVLPDHRISPSVDLFSVTLAPMVPTGAYTFDITLQDINDNTSPIVVGTVQVGGISTVPEPSNGLLAAAGAASMILFAVVNGRKTASA